LKRERRRFPEKKPPLSCSLPFVYQLVSSKVEDSREVPEESCLCGRRFGDTKDIPGLVGNWPGIFGISGAAAMAGAVQQMMREVMDIRQAADYLGISGDTLYRYASEGFIPAFKLGNRWRFKRSLLDAWMVKMSSTKAPTAVAVMPRQKKPVGRAR
jgi:excisionase family DNA binding protein